MRRAVALLIAALLTPTSSAIARDRAGDFDYWVLALSWSPQYCKSNPAESECVEPRAFVVHGLWPQHERGYPDYCGSRSEEVPDALEERMLEWMPSKELVRYQWRKHGSCSGMSMDQYFQNVERAYRRLVMPPDFRDPEDYIETSVPAIEDKFIELNPTLDHDGIALQCSGRWLKEIRICLDKALQPRACGDDVRDRCNASEVVVRPLRNSRLRQ
ncbi:ribonuclease T [Sinimarinibacterium sp. CAU 1509]|uniref:ribonuclease T2 family protein n=1 Tax=Sinimarinibacterium sp. CAU 1509 TaxID=2562283 RepID=UPI0010ACE37A|nr:ribonuclease T2 [Sinimarinibacterium sp. CAU 1509]TJY60815.1 ribonuclease T [Sinimarinibacterium sp. CAU 1509]